MNKPFLLTILFSSLLFGFLEKPETILNVLDEIINDPVPDKIQKSGTEIRLYTLATIPASSSGSMKTRINLLKQMPGPSGDLMINDLRGKMYRIDTTKQVHEYLNMKGTFPQFIDAPGKGTGFGAFAFHPEFQSNGVFFTTHSESPNGTADFTPNADNGIVMDWVLTKWTANDPTAGSFAGSHQEMIRFAYPGSIHGLQDLTFNPLAEPGTPDYGMLYICAGEGRSSLEGLGDANLQLSDSYLGSIFRIDPMGNSSTNGKYGIPADNPFVGTQTQGQEILAYGFRNPHRLCFDSRDNSTGYVLFVGDIGELNVEEINIVEPGKNYGWPVREGAFLYDWTDRNHVSELPANDSGFTYPVAMYDHDEGLAVVSGYVSRNNYQPHLQGQLILGDIVNGRLFHLPADSMIQGRLYPIEELSIFVNQSTVPTNMKIQAGGTRADTRFGYDHNGNMYVSVKGSGKVFSVGPYVNPVNNSTTANSELLSNQVEWVYQQEWLDIRKAQTGSNFQIISLDGRVVTSGEIGLSGKARVNLSAFSSGIYLFTLTYQGQVMSGKFVR